MLDALDLARWERTLRQWRDWIARLPAWEPSESVRALWSRVEPRIVESGETLDRILVVGFLGGTGTGKSTLINALVGERASEAGDVRRPTTIHPTILHHPRIAVDFLPTENWDAQTASRELPLLEQMILIDCPDPDTQGNDAGPNVNRDRLRAILPYCDVLICAGTAQKYKTLAVLDELTTFAPGRAILFVQTHAQFDPDIRDDWRKTLATRSFVEPTVLRVDSEQALVAAEQRLPQPPEFVELREILIRELDRRGHARLRRSNGLELWSWFATHAAEWIEPAWKKVAKLDESIDREAARLTEIARRHLQAELLRNRAAWRTRLNHDAAEAWGGGPFGLFLRVAANLWSWLRWLPLLRVRGVGGLVAAGAVGAGRAVVDGMRDDPARGELALTTATLGWGVGELAQTRSTCTGMAEDAGLVIESRAQDRADRVSGVLSQTQRALSESLDRRIAARVARQTSLLRQIPYEAAFCVLPAFLFGRWGYDFFYKHLWLGQTPAGWDVILQGLLWIVVWGWFWRVLLTRSLLGGWRKDAQAAIDELTPGEFTRPLFDDIGQGIRTVASSRTEFERLRNEIETWREQLRSESRSGLARVSVAKSPAS